MLPPPEILIPAAFVVAGAFVIFGITGFGSTIIAVPLLALGVFVLGYGAYAASGREPTFKLGSPDCGSATICT